VRVRVPLSGCPSLRWSCDLSAHLANELRGHAGVGHLRLNANEIVQGNQLVLEGVESSEVSGLAQALQGAIDAANRARTRTPDRTTNVAQEEADAIAREIAIRQP
jgi:hypothetical protein